MIQKLVSDKEIHYLAQTCFEISMKILKECNEIKIIPNLISMSIGNFDGVHLGHQQLIQRVITLAKEENGQSLLVTFENHPRSVLNKQAPLKPIYSFEKKCELLKEWGVDYLLVLKFTPELSLLTAEEFILSIIRQKKFSYLILGEDASFGKNREGNHREVLRIAEQYHFKVEYISPLTIDQKVVSSRYIRHLIEIGHLTEAEKLLGRKYTP